MGLQCRCGYQASSRQDLDEHVEIMCRIYDGEDHGEK